MNIQQSLSFFQLNGRILTIIEKLLKNNKFNNVKINYKIYSTDVFLNGKVYTISDERDLIKFKEDIKLLLKK